MKDTHEVYPIEIAGVKRDLRLFEVKPGLRIAILNILGDVELVDACAIALAEKLAPRTILLDVMMPEVDGWELLGRLSSHPVTADIPVVVCTILAQRDLALLMGASAFLRKPFTRGELLAVLDELVTRDE